MSQHFAPLVGLAGIWLAAVVMPGPNFFMVSRASLCHSRRAGAGVALGVAVGAGVWAVAALLGLQALFALFPWLFNVARIAGGCYILLLGLQALCRAARGNSQTEQHTAITRQRASSFRLGLYTSFSNPKTAVFFGSIFSALLPAQGPAWLFALAIVTLMAISICWYGCVACVFSLPAARRACIRWQRLVDALTGGLFSLLGIRLIAGRQLL